MTIHKYILLIFILFIFPGHYICAQSSESFINKGKWIKVKVKKTGIYKLSYEYLKKAGIDNPANIVVTGIGGAFSDYINKTDLLKNHLMPLYCEKGEDGVFGKGDYFLFFAKGPVDISYDNISGDFTHSINHYQDYASYLVGYGNIEATEIPVIQQPEAYEYMDIFDTDYFIFHEKSLRNLLKSGRNTVGEKFSATIEYSFDLSIPDISESEDVKIKASLLARGVTDSKYDIILNGNIIGSAQCSKVNVASFSSVFASSTVFSSVANGIENNILKIRFNREGSNVGWLDYFTVQARRKLIPDKGYLLFSDSKTVGSSTLIRYNIKSNAKLKIWDVTDINAVKEMQTTYSTGTNYLVTSTDKFRQYVAFDPAYCFNEPELEGKIDNSNLHNLSGVEMLIVTVSELEEEAERLAEFHREEGLDAKVVLADNIYNEFFSGQKHPIAIRDFVRHIYLNSANSESGLKYLCLFGDGSYDATKSLLPTWQTLNSVEPASSFVSDDFFGLLEEGEGEALGDLDIGVGRLPVNTIEEAAAVVDKIIAYKEAENASWITRLAFVADDADYNEHISHTEAIVDIVSTDNPNYRSEKLYLDAFPKQSDFGKFYYPDVNRELSRMINDGLFICNYIGHGNESGLAHEKILTEQDIEHWKNKDRLPLFITATCDFSRYDDHEKLSAGEKIFLREKGGAIALLSTTRLVYSSPNFILNKELFRHIFSKDSDGGHYRLGDIVRITKNSSNTGISMRNFSLIGDPALMLNYPKKRVKMLSVSDTLKAYGKVEISGEVCYAEGDIDEHFNGVVDLMVFDKNQEYNTLGNNSDPFKYFYRKNLIFRGSATVQNGQFTCVFPVSSDIDQTEGFGKVYFYAHNEYDDAFGSSDTIAVGGENKDYEADNTGPVINMFINNDKFVYGGITDNNPLLFARLNDKSGINTTGYNQEHNIVVTLDGQSSVVLNQNFVSDIDDFSRGTVWYRLSDLSSGKHSITLDAWDNYGNHSSKEISFIVNSEKKSILKSFFNYPNPAREYTDFYFEHNMPDQEFEGEILIYNLSGQLVKIINVNGVDTGYRFGPFRWNLDNESGSKGTKGIYVAELILRNKSGKILKISQKVVVSTY